MAFLQTSSFFLISNARTQRNPLPKTTYATYIGFSQLIAYINSGGGKKDLFASRSFLSWDNLVHTFCGADHHEPSTIRNNISKKELKLSHSKLWDMTFFPYFQFVSHFRCLDTKKSPPENYVCYIHSLLSAHCIQNLGVREKSDLFAFRSFLSGSNLMLALRGVDHREPPTIRNNISKKELKLSPAHQPDRVEGFFPLNPRYRSFSLHQNRFLSPLWGATQCKKVVQ